MRWRGLRLGRGRLASRLSLRRWPAAPALSAHRSRSPLTTPPPPPLHLPPNQPNPNSTVTSKFNELVYQYPIRIPERYSLVIRSLLTQEGICLTLKPQFHFLEVAYPYVAR